MIRDLDGNGDIKAGNFLYEQKSIALDIKCKIQQFKSENPFDLDEGIDWTNELPSVDDPKLRVLIEDVILNTTGVVGLESRLAFDYDILNRVLNTVCDVKTIYGSIKSEVGI